MKSGTINVKSTEEMIEIIKRLTINCIIFEVQKNDNGGWTIDILGA